MAGLVTETRQGRQRIYAVTPEPLHDLQSWLAPYERFWRTKLVALRQHLEDT